MYVEIAQGEYSKKFYISLRNQEGELVMQFSQGHLFHKLALARALRTFPDLEVRDANGNIYQPD